MPDFALPDALCVPYWRFENRPMLEEIARAACLHTGVILVSLDPSGAEAFARTLPRPDHVAVIPGSYDTPWLRDHSPLAFTDHGQMAALRPSRPESGRDRDLALFNGILAEPPAKTEILIARGNLVVGDDGLAVTTHDAFRENAGTDQAAFVRDAERTGIREWLFVPFFDDDRSRHTDTMLRFLGPRLAAVARRPRDPDQDLVAQACVEALGRLRPGIEIIEIPVETRGGTWDSPLNWIQLGSHLLVPDQSDLPGNLQAVRDALEPRGFGIVSVPLMTDGLGGGPHCLTASVFA